jgi:hypothetical protein
MLTHLTRYQVSVVLNEALKESGYEGDPIPSQRLYNKSTKIRTELVGDQQLVPVEEAVRFVKAFINRSERQSANLEEILEMVREDS